MMTSYKTQPVFVIGTGRSGTYQLSKLFQGIDEIEVKHEYLFENFLKSCVLYRMGIIDEEKIVKLITSDYLGAIKYNNTKFWLDCSNALAWIVEPLYKVFPEAKFIHVVRDGRKVVSSFYNKFEDVMYNDKDVSVLLRWLKNSSQNVEPPSEKKYWRPVPSKGERYYNEFSEFSRYQRLCYYWQDCVMKINESFQKIPDSQKFVFSFEDILYSNVTLKDYLNIFELDINSKFLAKLKKPINVEIPKDFPLTEEQTYHFWEIAGDAMKFYNYKIDEEYDVRY
jgi:hypothetical protein